MKFSIRWAFDWDFFFSYWNPIGSAPCVKKTILSPLNYFCTFVKSQLAIFSWVYFWNLYSVILIYESVSLPVPHCLDYCSFIVRPKSGSMVVLTLFLFFKFVSAILVPLLFHKTFRMNLPISTEKNPAGILLEFHYVYSTIGGDLTFFFCVEFYNWWTQYVSLYNIFISVL